MKKALSVILMAALSLTLMFGMTGCGEEKVTLTNKTVNGLSFDVPDDFSDFAETQEVMLSKNEDSTASIVVSKELDMSGIRPEDITKEYYQQTVIPNYTDVSFIEFKTNVSVSHTTAVYAHFTTKKADGLEVEAHAYLIYLPAQDGDGKMQSVMFSFTKDTESSLEANIDAVKSSLKFE